MARPVFSINNKLVKEILVDFVSFYDTPSWINDIIRGSKGQVATGTNSVSSSTIFRMIQSLDEINTKTVGDFMNRKKQAIDGTDYSKRMIEYYTAAARCASQGISHQLAITVVVEQVASAKVSYGVVEAPKVYGFGMSRDFTEQERETVRRLSITGSSQELKDYINSIK